MHNPLLQGSYRSLKTIIIIISFSRPGKSWNLVVGHGKSWKIIVCGIRKLLQESKQGQNKIQASYVRKYPKTRMLLEFPKVVALENWKKSWKRSWNLKSSKKQYEPCDKDPKLSIVLFECLCGGFQYLQE